MLFTSAIIVVASSFALGLLWYFVFDRRGRQLPIALHPISYGVIAIVYMALEGNEIKEFELVILIFLCLAAFYGPSIVHYSREYKKGS